MQHDNNSEGSPVRHAILIMVLVLTAACAKQQVTPTASGGGTRTSSGSGSAVGASTSRAAVEGFLSAVKTADLQAMSSLWGNDKTLARDKMSRDELEKRLVIMQCSLQHDRSTFVDDAPQMRAGGRRVWSVNLTRKRVTKKANMVTVQGPAGRWYVEDVPNIMELKELCT
jgi:hypothetical protein